MGKILRVAGPVVTAEDIAEAKMYDVVRVGEMGLVGEIIRMEGGKSTIQVYEDTSGIKPGDPVESTKRPLSVLLAPGIIKSIYDGIQRPLDVIKSQGGDFIKRGLYPDPVDMQKSWEFVPQVKRGQKVQPGDIVGTVRETGIIEHRIMVPSGVEGEITEISPGKFKVLETVAYVSTSSGIREITLGEYWPVRMPRPVRGKLPPTVPLITGQRVIDTFFPVAKGGTVAVPGPFGSGKCVLGDTPVLLDDGTLIRIEDLYNKHSAEGIRNISETEEIIELQEPIGLLSLVDGRIVRSESHLIYKGKSDSVVRVKTRTGREVKVTPVHKLFKLNREGDTEEKMAGELSVGDFILSARNIPNNRKNVRIEISGLRSGEISEATVNRLPAPDPIAGGKVSNPFRIPQEVTNELAEFLGHYAAGGYMEGEGTIIFRNSDDAVISRFSELASKLFGISVTAVRLQGMSHSVSIQSSHLAEFLDYLGAGKEEGRKSIPSVVLRSSREAISSYLGAYFTSGGSFKRGIIELTAYSQELYLQLSYLLAGYGIIHARGREVVNGKHCYITSISGRDNIQTFLSAVHSGTINVNSIIQYLGSNGSIHEDMTAGTQASGNGQVMLMEEIRGEANVSSQENTPALVVQEAEATYWDEIVEMEELTGPFTVYDVSVPNYRQNFVGGNGGIILHNTVVQHQLAKWADSDIVVYVGCGERGNEMTEILSTFPNLTDPRSGSPLMERTVLIANTSNMPVAAREASIYTGVTIAEYFRDMGYNVALMADSTSRWAEALREISGRLEEMPGEEGYPAYLGRKLAEFYERSGNARLLGSIERTGSITIIGAVSPPGGDISEPVSQNTLRVTRVFWGLDASLAQRRHFPSVNWLTSYSLYASDLRKWYEDNVSADWFRLYTRSMEILQKESELQEVAQLVGYDALPENEKQVLDTAKSIREDILQQSAFDEVDTYCSLKKQHLMLSCILSMDELAKQAVSKGVTVSDLQTLPFKEKISRFKEVKEAEIDSYHSDLIKEMEEEIKGRVEKQ